MSTAVIDNIPQLLKDVQTLLDAKCKRRNFRLKVPQDGYRREDDWIIIAVTPSNARVRAYDYVEILSEVEKELRGRGFEQVVLWPALPD